MKEAILSWLHTAGAEAIGWALVHSVWEIGLLALVVGVLLMLLRRRSPQVRYLAGCAGLAAMLAAPVGTYVWLMPAKVAIVHEQLEPDAAPLPVMAASFEPVRATFEMPRPVRQPTALERMRAWVRPWLPGAVAAYLAGIVICSLRLMAGFARLRQLRRHAVEVPDRFHQLLGILVGRLKIRSRVRLLESALVEVPTMLGFLRPVILLPATAMTGLSAEQLSALVAHELAHVRRHDYLANVVQSVIETILFYHPAVWWLSARIRQEREHCCDDMAVALAGSRVTYVKALAAMEGLRGLRGAPAQLAVGARGGALLPRIRRLLENSAKPLPGFAAPTALLMAALLATMLYLGCSKSGDDGQAREGAATQSGVAADNAGASTTQPSEQFLCKAMLCLVDQEALPGEVRRAGDGLMTLQEDQIDSEALTRRGNLQVLSRPNLLLIEGMEGEVTMGDTGSDVATGPGGAGGAKLALTIHRESAQKLAVRLNAHMLRSRSDAGFETQLGVTDGKTVAILGPAQPQAATQGAAAAQAQGRRMVVFLTVSGNAEVLKSSPIRPVAKGEILRVSVFELMTPGKETVNELPVNEQGNLHMPLIGDVHVEGLTPAAIEDRIAEALVRKNMLLPKSAGNPGPQVVVNNTGRTTPLHPVAPGEFVKVSVYELPAPGETFTETLQVNERGEIPLRNVGRLKVAGMTPSEIETAIAKATVEKGLLMPAGNGIAGPSVNVMIVASPGSDSRSGATPAVGDRPQAQTATTMPTGGLIPYRDIQVSPDNWNELTRDRTGKSSANSGADLVARLELPIHEVTFDGEPLQKTVDYLRNTTDTNIFVNWKSLEAAGIHRTMPVKLSLREVPFRKVLTSLLSEVGEKADLGWVVDDGVITISTREDLEAAKPQSVKVYDIRDLLVRISAMATPQAPLTPGSENRIAPPPPLPDQQRQEIIQQIVTTIESTVAPKSWRDKGGTIGSIHELNGQLIVNQTEDNQKEVLALIQQLREEQSLYVALEMKVMLVNDDLFKSLPQAKAADGAPHDATASVLLDEKACQQALKAIQASPDSTTVTAPRITLFSGQKGYVFMGDALNYIAGCTAKTDEHGKLAPDLKIDTLKTGINVDVVAAVTADRRSTVVHLNPTFCKLLRVDTVPAPDTPGAPDFMIQKPVLQKAEYKIMSNIPDGQTMLLSGLMWKGALPDKNGNAGDNEAGKEKHLVVLVRPMILTRSELPSDQSGNDQGKPTPPSQLP